VRIFGYTARQAKIVAPIIMRYRQAMRRASRFVLDDEFTRYATEVSSHTEPEKLLYRLQFCTLPYQTTWLEFDLHVKVRTMRAIHGMPGLPDNVPQRMGVLMERVDNTLSTVTMVLSGSAHDVVAPNMTGYLFSLDERAVSRHYAYHGLVPFGTKDSDDSVITEQMHRVSRGSMWGYTVKGGPSGMIESGPDLVRSISLPGLLERHGSMAFTPFYDFVKLGMGRPRENADDPLSDALGSEMVEFAGMMRWLVCVLAMLNEVPTSAAHVQPTHTVRHGLTGRKPAMDYHRLTLRLPKTKPVPYIQRQLSPTGRKRQAHEVCEHWRTYMQNNACRHEEHDWEYDYPGGYRLCGKCLSFSRLIHEHVRGDPSLGWVRKSYVIKPSNEE